jgi:hypothetical protein
LGLEGLSLRRKKPLGIRAELPAPARDRYDYWAVRKNGDFYLLQSLFEDSRERNALFFNTRIVRVTEALMFAGKPD